MRKALFLFLGVMFGMSSNAENCSLGWARTEADYIEEMKCIRESHFQPICKDLIKLYTGIRCIQQMTVNGFCAGFFVVGYSPKERGYSSKETSAIEQLFDSMSVCSVDSSLWDGASSEEQVADLLRQYAGCIEPLLDTFVRSQAALGLRCPI